MEDKIVALIDLIKDAFSGVTLENGISWREADVIDSYGSTKERKKAREGDVINNWNQIPFNLIGDLMYQDVLPFLDARGLKYYLAPCMIYTLENYKDSDSLITHSIIYTLIRETTVKELKEIITIKQKISIIHFLSLCLEIGDDYFDLHNTEINLKKYWIEEQ